MTEFIDFNLSPYDYSKLAYEAGKRGDIENNIAYLLKAIELRPYDHRARFALAMQYSSLHCYEMSNEILFKILNEISLTTILSDRAFEQLALNFSEMDDRDAFEYYISQCTDDIDVDLSPLQDPSNKLYVSYPKDDDYYEKLIGDSYELIHQDRIDDAIALLDEVDKSSKLRSVADNAALVAMMMRNDLDSVIQNARDMLARGEDNLAISCSLITALMMEDREQEAREALEHVLEKEYTELDDIMIILPILVNMKEHSEVAKYSQLALGIQPLQPHIMVWESEALYNLGRVDEAVSMIKRVGRLFPSYEPPKYVLEMYDSSPATVEYTIGLPFVEKMRRVAELEKFMTDTPANSYTQFVNDPSVKANLNWALKECRDEFRCVIVDKLSTIRSQEVTDFLKTIMSESDMTYELLQHIAPILLRSDERTLKCRVVARNKYKEVEFDKPTAMYGVSEHFARALEECFVEVIYADEEPSYYLNVLSNIVETNIVRCEGDILTFAHPFGGKVMKLKSVKTIFGVLLAKLYEDDEEDSAMESIKRYGLSRRTFDKYYKLIFGEGDDEDGE